MAGLTLFVENEIKEKLPKRFDVVFVGWSGGDTHYVSVFETFPPEVRCGYRSFLLALAPFGDEDMPSAGEHFEFLQFFAVNVRMDHGKRAGTCRR